MTPIYTASDATIAAFTAASRLLCSTSQSRILLRWSFQFNSLPDLPHPDVRLQRVWPPLWLPCSIQLHMQPAAKCRNSGVVFLLSRGAEAAAGCCRRDGIALAGSLLPLALGVEHFLLLLSPWMPAVPFSGPVPRGVHASNMALSCR
jgi:hypothetical protein